MRCLSVYLDKFVALVWVKPSWTDPVCVWAFERMPAFAPRTKIWLADEYDIRSEAEITDGRQWKLQTSKCAQSKFATESDRFFLQIRLGQENLMIIFKMSFIEMERKLHWQLQSFRNCRFVEYVDDLLKSRQKDVYFPTCTHPYMKVRTEMCKKVLKKIHC